MASRCDFDRLFAINLLGLLLMPLGSNAKLYLDINGMSKHLNTEQEFKEVNQGLGITAEQVEKKLVRAVQAGYYRNSKDEDSFYAAIQLMKRFGNKIYGDIGVTAGGLTGYEEYGFGKVTPVAGITGRLGIKDAARASVTYVPSFQEEQPAVLMGNISIPFK